MKNLSLKVLSFLFLVPTLAHANDMICSITFRDMTDGSDMRHIEQRVTYTDSDWRKRTVLIESFRFQVGVSTHMNGVTLSVYDKSKSDTAGSGLVSYAGADITPGNFSYVDIALSTDDVFVWGSCALDGDSRRKADTDVRFKNVAPADTTTPARTDSIPSNPIH